MRIDWHEAGRRKGISFSTPKRPGPNQRCLAQLWEKLDNGTKVKPGDLRYCSQCVSTLKFLQRKGWVHLTPEGCIKRTADRQSQR